MASPQREDGYTAIANEIMDALCRIRIPGEARQVFDVIFRKTYGWNKREDAISLSQFSEATGLSKPHVIHSLAKLNIMRLISEKGNAISEKGNSICKVYEINKDIDKWRSLPKKETALPKSSKIVAEKGNAALPKKEPTKDTVTKAITKAKAQRFALPDWIKPETWAAFREMRRSKRAPLTDRATVLIVRELEKLRKSGNDPEAVLNQSIMKSWTGVFPIKIETSPYKPASSGERDVREYQPEELPDIPDEIRQGRLKEIGGFIKKIGAIGKPEPGG